MSVLGGLEDTPQLLNDLIQKCFEAKEKAYSPYSKFRVGAALLTKGGQIFTGIDLIDLIIDFVIRLGYTKGLYSLQTCSPHTSYRDIYSVPVQLQKYI